MSQVSAKGTGAAGRVDKARLVHKGPPNQAKGNVDSGTGRTQEDTLEGCGKGIPGLERPLPPACFAECSTSGSIPSADTTHSLPS